jgi:sugar-specific transcriptional regulator TrmB
MHKEFKEIDRLSERLRTKVKEAPESKEHDSPVWVLKNRENIYSKIDSLINNAKQSILIASSESGIKRKIETYGDSLRQAKKRGVNITIMTPTENEHTKRASEYATIVKKPHDQRMFIADDNVLLFLSPEHEEKKEMGAWIKSQHFAESQRKFMHKCEF